jgi:hypothetical protein
MDRRLEKGNFTIGKKTELGELSTLITEAEDGSL